MSFCARFTPFDEPEKITHSTSSNSTSKTKVALGGMTGGEPAGSVTEIRRDHEAFVFRRPSFPRLPGPSP